MEEVKDSLDKQAALAKHIINFRTTALKTTKDKRTIGWFKTQIESLETIWKIFFNDDLALTKYAEAQQEHEYFSAELYTEAFTQYNCTKSDFLGALNPGRNQSTIQADVDQANLQIEAPIYKNPLPPISLPKFAGKRDEWEVFKGMFIALVHDVPAIPPVMKLQHLAGSLEGEAKTHLPRPPYTADKYSIAWKTLNERYDAKKSLLSTHLNSVVSCPRMKKHTLVELNRVIDTMRVSKQCIDGLEIPAGTIGDLWLIHHVSHKLDFRTLVEWEAEADGLQDYPTYDEFLKFLQKQSRVLEAAKCSYGDYDEHSHSKSQSNLPKSKSVSSHQSQTSSSVASCPLCKNDHFLYACPKFKEMQATQKFEFCKGQKLCINCLREGHYLKGCKSQRKCFKCHQKHHTLLHREEQDKSCNSSSKDNFKETKEPSQDSQITISTHCSNQSSSKEVSLCGSVLLGTALVILADPLGNSFTVRALIDPGSERSFISERVLSCLSLQVNKVKVTVTGVGASITSVVKKETSIIVKSNSNREFTQSLSVYVLDKLTRLLPKAEVTPTTWPHIVGLNLADPRFFKPDYIDCIFGADIYSNIMLSGVIKGPPGSPLAQKTVFGWILIGQLSPEALGASPSVQVFHTYTENSLDSLLIKFWEMEEVPSKRYLSTEERECEDYFTATTTRNEEGRYVVRLPFKKVHSFEGSRDKAVACLLRTEKNLAQDPILAQKYKEYFQEYLKLNHLELVPKNQINRPSYYIPPHAVPRHADSDKIRVVFNASQKDKRGISLNEILSKGPKLQSDITVILLRWKFYKFVFTTDIIKMFRQILVHDGDRDWQRIVWREDPSHSIQDYRVTTVVQGTAAAPFLAIRVIKQLAHDGRSSYPDAAELLDNQVYVDDVFGGSDDLDSAIRQRDQSISLLGSAGMKLDKWASNHSKILQGVADAKLNEVEVKVDEVSTLGIKWLPGRDLFILNFNNESMDNDVTKRTILSHIAKLFDPLGWITPVITVAKIIIQDLWLANLDWDQPVSSEILTRWNHFHQSLVDLKAIKIQRWVGFTNQEKWQLHGFADASKRVYAAVLYAVVPGKSSILLVAKAKLAPTTVQTLPRLELCAATLLVKLTEHVVPNLPHPPEQIHFWSDSKVVLDWLKGHPSRWQTFVANRVSKITSTTLNATWRHVRSSDNAADCATRGLYPNQLAKHTLWWSAPGWILKSTDEWPHSDDTQSKQYILQTFLTEEKVEAYVDVLSILERVSSFNKIQRLLAYAARWRLNAFKPKQDRSSGHFTVQEWTLAHIFCFRAIQKSHYSKELDLLTKEKSLHKLSSIARCSPFIDKDGLIRVGGRLEYASLPYNERHPVILPGSNLIIKRYVNQVHEYTMHGGVQLMLSHLYRRVWITQAPRLVKKIFRTCVKCTRYRARSGCQKMASLPVDRITPIRPFQVAGLDYAGPIPVLFSRGRGAKSTKGHVAIFICFVSRAVHIEIVSDLTSDAFLAAYARFAARRGACVLLYSDNATTFKGAAKELIQMYNETSEFSKTVKGQLALQGTEWTFIPPRAPHFGGLWEAAVKSFKFHFTKAIGNSTFTFEELSTLAAKIEACLNSRPLCPLDNESSEPAALTPGHFLIGSSCLAPPEPIDISQKSGLRQRWILISQLRNSFWDRWRKEVLHHLQLRNKWLKTQSNLKQGDVVIIKDELTPPSTWPLGLVIKTHPGKDSLVRTVTVKTANSKFIRPIVKLIKLPTEEDEDESLKTTTED